MARVSLSCKSLNHVMAVAAAVVTRMSSVAASAALALAFADECRRMYLPQMSRLKCRLTVSL
uniref:hypothetical protein n=1 Tax=Desulfovibrio sp. An276 TaxID=1965618 RepID=UPI001EF58154|nr:hypothetical protein [Desulfovibrio sp. An276]